MSCCMHFGTAACNTIPESYAICWHSPLWALSHSLLLELSIKQSKGKQHNQVLQDFGGKTAKKPYFPFSIFSFINSWCESSSLPFLKICQFTFLRRVGEDSQKFCTVNAKQRTGAVSLAWIFTLWFLYS